MKSREGFCRYFCICKNADFSFLCNLDKKAAQIRAKSRVFFGEDTQASRISRQNFKKV